MKPLSKAALVCALASLSANSHSACEPHNVPQPYFGDLHVHTALSNDANGMGISARPAEAYRYAQGEAIAVNDVLTVTPGGKLDFAAVTDHAEQFAAATLCHDPQSPSYQRWSCKLERSKPRIGLLLGQLSSLLFGPEGGPHCAEGACTQVRNDAWQETVDAAEQANQPCDFTTFVAYEWTGNAEAGGTIHRNVIFNQNPQLATPFDAQSHKTPTDLFNALKTHCVDGTTGCDALTIPHNSNLSKGMMFPRQETLSAEDIAGRTYFDRLAEIIQHKGASECYAGIGASDEACAFEALPYASFIGKFIPLLGKPPENDTSFVREALKEGLAVASDNSGQNNPYQLGLIGSTDTHLATPGQTDEKNYTEHHNRSQLVGEKRIPKQAELNPGGLAVIYSRSNTREALFAAMKRREVYATSGTRIGLRFFAGDDLPKQLCANPYALHWAYTRGRPMGATLSARNPQFFVMANKAPGRHSAGLQSLQLVKGWIDEAGNTREKVIALANTHKADLASCSEPMPAEETLCVQWQDPEFNPEQKSFYYVRVLEQPSCRWDQHICEKLDDPQQGENLQCSAEIQQIQERAWSSPIWFTPGQG